MCVSKKGVHCAEHDPGGHAESNRAEPGTADCHACRNTLPGGFPGPSGYAQPPNGSEPPGTTEPTNQPAAAKPLNRAEPAVFAQPSRPAGRLDEIHAERRRRHVRAQHLPLLA